MQPDIGVDVGLGEGREIGVGFGDGREIDVGLGEGGRGGVSLLFGNGLVFVILEPDVLLSNPLCLQLLNPNAKQGKANNNNDK